MDQLPLINNLFLEYHSFVHEKQYLSEILAALEEHGFVYHIQDEFKLKAPLLSQKTSLGQRMQLNIWATK